VDLYKAVKIGVGWLCESDIWIKDENSILHGAYCSAYDISKKIYPLVYNEITAYALQFWLYVSKRFACENGIKNSILAGDYLVRAQNNDKNSIYSGAFYYGYKLPNSQKIQKFFSFDTSICISALIDIYKAIGDERYQESALNAGKWLKGMQREDGSFKAALFFEDDSEEMMQWYGNGTCLHAKNAIALIKLGRLCNDEGLISIAKKTLNWVLDLQAQDGSFRASKEQNYVITHAHCYSLEGLLYGYHIVEEKKYLEAAIKGGTWILKAQNQDGSLSRYYGPEINAYLDTIKSRIKFFRKMIRPRETGATAQAIRIWLALYKQTKNKVFLEASYRSAKFLLSMQCHKNDQNAYGGFYSSCDKFIYYTKPSSQLFSWVTMFSCQALSILEDTSKQTFSELMELLF